MELTDVNNVDEVESRFQATQEELLSMEAEPRLVFYLKGVAMGLNSYLYRIKKECGLQMSRDKATLMLHNVEKKLPNSKGESYTIRLYVRLVFLNFLNKNPKQMEISNL